VKTPRSGVRRKGSGGGRDDDGSAGAKRGEAPAIVPQQVVIIASPSGVVVQKGGHKLRVRPPSSPSPATERSAGSSQPLAGIPGPIAEALAEYRRRCEDLERMGMSKAHAHAEILAESRETDGIARAGETINLSMWSRRLHIPRAVLEALVLAAYHARPPPTPPRAIEPQPQAREVPTSSAPGTPAPRATRRPKVPSSRRG
jgi:hypothetical protein